MTTTTISLSEEAYENLKGLKGEGESFSDVVMRLTGGKKTEEYREELERDLEEQQSVLSGR